MADDADIFREVNGIHLRQLTGSGDRLQDGHGHGDLDIPFHRAGGSLFDQHGEGGDQHGVQFSGHALRESVIVRSHKADLLILHPLFEGHDIFCHVPYGLDVRAALDLERIENILRLGADRVFIGDVVSDGPHFFPVKLLGIKPHPVVEVCLIDIEIHHAGIRASDLGQICIAEAPPDLCRAAPVFDLRLHIGVAALYDAGDHSVTLAGSLQIGHHLTHCAAGIQLAEPGRGIRVLIVRGLLFLDVHQYHRDIQIPDCRQHVVGSRIGQKLQDDQIYIRRAEQIPGSLRHFLRGDNASVHDLNGGGQRFLKITVLLLKFRHQGRELREVGSQRDGKYTDFCFCFY